MARFAVGGTVQGLQGTVVLTDGTERVTLTSDGDWAFPTTYSIGAAYMVAVDAHPMYSSDGPEQTCTVSNASGVVGSEPVTNVDVICSTEAFSISGEVHGLAVGATVKLHNNGGDELPIVGTSDPSVAFSFSAKVASGAPYEVTVVSLADPTAGNTTGSAVEQHCDVDGASGVVSDQNVEGVVVTCEAVPHTVRVELVGLPDGESVTVENVRTATETTPVPADNTESLVLDANGISAFTSTVSSGQTYAVSVTSEPSYSHCTVGDDATGTIGAEDVTVTVTCKECGEGGPCLAFVTSTKHTGKLGGLAGADTICQARAAAAMLPGQYKAWLSDATESPSTRFMQSTGPYVLTDGQQLAEDWSALTSGALSVPLNRTEAGDLLTDTSKEAWTNTTTMGTVYSTNPDVLCDGWTDDWDGLSGRVGETDQIGTRWTSSHHDPCNSTWRLYCFQQN